MVFFHMFSASLKKWQHHRNHWMQRGHLKFLVQDKGPAASCPSGRTLTGCWCKSTTGRGDNCVKVWGDLDWLVFFGGAFFFSRKLASASWSPSCFSKELGGLESPIAWNFMLNYPPPSSAAWFTSSLAVSQSPPGTPSACRHRQQIQQHPHRLNRSMFWWMT